MMLLSLIFLLNIAAVNGSAEYASMEYKRSYIHNYFINQIMINNDYNNAYESQLLSEHSSKEIEFLDWFFYLTDSRFCEFYAFSWDHHTYEDALHGFFKCKNFDLNSKMLIPTNFEGVWLIHSKVLTLQLVPQFSHMPFSLEKRFKISSISPSKNTAVYHDGEEKREIEFNREFFTNPAKFKYKLRKNKKEKPSRFHRDADDIKTHK